MEQLSKIIVMGMLKKAFLYGIYTNSGNTPHPLDKAWLDEVFKEWIQRQYPQLLVVGKELNLEAFHPGEFLKEELHERGMRADELASHLGLTVERLQAIFDGKAHIGSVTGVLIERLWGISAELWCGMQLAWDIQEARKSFEKP